MKRKIEDVFLPPFAQKPLRRPTKQNYQDCAARIHDCLQQKIVPIVLAPMGWGKTSYLTQYIY